MEIVRRRRWSDELRSEPARCLPSNWGLCGPRSQRRKAGRSADLATDQVRACHQPQDSKGHRNHHSGNPPSERRRGDRMKRRAFITLLGGAAAAWPLAAGATQPRPVGMLLTVQNLVASAAGSGQHLASVLQEGRENANIDAGLGFIWRISAGIVSPLLGSQADAGVGDRKLNPVASAATLRRGENQRAECGTVACAVWATMDCNGTDSMSSWGHFAKDSRTPKST